MNTLPSSDPVATWQSLPSAARWLGLAGLIPFFAGAIAILAAPPGWPLVKLMAAVCIYGVAILSFLGGVAWGAAMTRGERAWMPYVMAVAPSLVGWFALLFVYPFHQPFVLALAFGLLWLADRHHTAVGRFPQPYFLLRTLLSVGVVVSLLAAGFALLSYLP
ncbi:MAG: hypothetical protein Kilf2KO_42840 [Rhodospirillales bacterium]